MSRFIDAVLTVALCAFVLAAFMAGAAQDPGNHASTEDRCELQTQRAQAARLKAVRLAYQAGLEEGTERERYARQRFLADVEQGARP